MQVILGIITRILFRRCLDLSESCCNHTTSLKCVPPILIVAMTIIKEYVYLYFLCECVKGLGGESSMIAFLGNCFSDWPKDRFIGLYKW